LAPEKKETDAPKAEGDSPLKGLGLDTEALVGDLSADTLASYQKARTEWTRAQSTADDWKKRLDALDTERLKQKARAFSEGIKTLPSGVEGLKAAPALISEGKALLAEVERARDTQRSLQEALKTDLRQSKEALADIERLKSADVDRIVGKVKSGFSVEGVAARLVGPAWVGRGRGRRVHGPDRTRRLMTAP
jgi:chromosome segregation ATPase